MRTGLLTAIVVGLSAGPATAADPTFNAHVRPIFQAYCTECHGEAEKLKGGLDLRLRRFVLKGGDSGPAVVAGKPDESELLAQVADGTMPPGKKKLSAAEIDVIRRWIAAGAKVEAPEPETLARGFQINDSDRTYWAFQPVKRPAVPAVKGDTTRNPIDAFLLSKLAEKKLAFAPPADRVTLIRRVSLDLIGLPPTPEEIDAFVKDMSANAFEKVVERLLASPHYGERWGRHWLDVAGYADSEGGAPADQVRTNAWQYRDYVIRSFNADKPFDRFVTEQLAGDELVKPPYKDLSPADLDALTATGFLRNAPDGTGAPGVDQKLARNQVLTDTVKIVSSSFLGLTVGCAQCHNHRYDPIPQADFYRLRAAFEPAYDLTTWKPPAARQVSLYTDADRKKAAAVEAEAGKIDAVRLKRQGELIEATFEKELAKLPEEMQPKARAARATPEAKRNPEQKKLMQQHPSLNVSAGSLYLYDSKAAAELKVMADEAANLRKTKPVEVFVRALTETPGKVPVTFLHHRGDPDQPKEAVPPGGLSVLDTSLPLQPPAKPLPTGSTGRRLELAKWLTDPKHPLTARVMVNRVWMHHFGRGLVGTPGDFGRLGEAPTHPELLDWLAAEFVAPSASGRRQPAVAEREQPADAGRSPGPVQAWSVKHLHRLIVTSAAYRQSSARGPQADADPANQLLGRFPLRRLDAEAIRDSVMAVAGNLNPKMYGPPVPVTENEVGMVVLGIDTRDGAGRFEEEIPLPPGDEFRRSVYVQVRRSRPLAVLDTFDGATVEPNCEVRNSSTATPQALMLLNGDFVIAQAGVLAERLRKDASDDTAAQVRRAWRLAYGREPTAKELSGAEAFLREATETFRKLPPPPAPAAKPTDPRAGNKGTGSAEPKPATAPPTPEARALAAFCQAVLSSNRFLYVD